MQETIKVLEGLKKKYEQHHDLKYSKASLKAAAELSAKHINDKFLPDKAIDVIDEAGARLRLNLSTKRKTVNEQDVDGNPSCKLNQSLQSMSLTHEAKEPRSSQRKTQGG